VERGGWQVRLEDHLIGHTGQAHVIKPDGTHHAGDRPNRATASRTLRNNREMVATEAPPGNPQLLQRLMASVEKSA
jgi:hypothetical protein